MKAKILTAAEASAVVSELRAMALLPPGQNEGQLGRAKEIAFQLNAIPGSGSRIGSAAKVAYGLIEVLLSHRRWKTEASSLESLPKDIKSACDRLRVGVEAAFHAAKPR